MDYEKIKNTTLEVFLRFQIKSFPLDCIKILKGYGIKVESYSSQKPKKKNMCISFSEDAFTLKNTVYYNDEQVSGRIMFSLAHEIGHIALNHTAPCTEEQEKEADCFASYLIAPRMAIHYSGCKNHVDVSDMFGMSNEAAQYSFNDYRRWHRRAVYKMNDFDKAIYKHFYNDTVKKFVYHIELCPICGNELYNNSKTCVKCLIYYSTHKSYSSKMDDVERAVSTMRNNWLYGL
jgi:Zn-dependent peptidase ImmA (M78 family)